MAGRVIPVRPPLITDARLPASLSTDQRARRYVITMAFRVACFIAAILTPAPWNAILFVAAAILPGIAVLFGNARDNRPDPAATDDLTQPALLPGALVPGEVAEGDGQREVIAHRIEDDGDKDERDGVVGG